jgi:hypothetical protein
MTTRKLNWTESAGGPLVMMPRSKALSWKGVENGDYEEACQVEDYTGIIARTWGDVIVLNDEPLRTACLVRHDGVAVIRWMYAPSEKILLEVALALKMNEHQAAERLKIRLLNEPYVIFDSGRDGKDPDGLETELPATAQQLITYVVRDKANEVGFILHRFG